MLGDQGTGDCCHLEFLTEKMNPRKNLKEGRKTHMGMLSVLGRGTRNF